MTVEKEGVANSLSDSEKLAIEELRRPTESILNQLKPEIDSGAYGVIIGDDASGRLPAILLWKILGIVYEKRGYPKPLLRFVAGSTGLAEGTFNFNTKKEDVGRHIGRIRRDVKSDEAPSRLKALIVTDTIATGESVQMLMNGIKENNWTADVATIGLMSPVRFDELQDRWKCKIAVGSKLGLPRVYIDGRNLSGVTKDRNKLFSSPRRESRYMNFLETALDPNFTSKEYNFKVRDARKLIDGLAQELAEKFMGAGK